MNKTPVALVMHAAIVLALIISGTVLTATGNNATMVWGLLAGYLGGVSVVSGVTKVQNGG